MLHNLVINHLQHLLTLLPHLVREHDGKVALGEHTQEDLKIALDKMSRGMQQVLDASTTVRAKLLPDAP